MKDVLTVEQMRAAEADAIARGLDGEYLSMNAALCIADGLNARASADGAETAFFCGNGGNGCDGILAAVRMHRQGKRVTVYKATDGDGSAFYRRTLGYAQNAGVAIKRASEYDGNADILVDAIFGIGLNRSIEGETKALIEKLNAQEDAFRLAVDIPSGLNGDTGEVMGVAFDARVTLTFSCYKRGMLFGSGRDKCGEIVVDDVGIATRSDMHVYEDGDFKEHRRKVGAHKGDMGRVFVIGGCGTMIGAPILAGAAAHSAYLNGAGTVTVCMPSIHRVAATSRYTLSMLKFLSDTKDGFIKFDKGELDEIISRATAINIGTGMGATPDLKKILEYICDNFDGKLIVDADGLNAIAGGYSFLRGSKPQVLLTPHVGEFRRLTGKPATVENAVALADDIGGIVVMKSATTVITDGKEVRLNVAGTPAMAKGGTGDVLGGCITALSCSYPLFDAATIACYRNGMGAERAVSAYAQMMLTPRDILNMADYDEL